MGLRVLIIASGPSPLVQAALGLSHRGHSVLLCCPWEGARDLPEVRRGLLRLLSWPFALAGLLGPACRLCACCLCLRAWQGLGGRYDVALHDRASVALPCLLLLAPRAVLYSRMDDWRLPGALAAAASGVGVLLHSEFARGALRRGELGLAAASRVLRPPVDASPPLLRGGLRDRTEWHRAFEEYTAQVAFRALVAESAPFLLVLGAYEPAQRLELALEAFARLPPSPGPGPGPVLVIAADYDARSAPQRRYHEDLRLRAEMAGLERRVVFLRSVSAPLKSRLLNAAVAAVYTAQHELSGTAPCEAMAAAVPVIASEDGGPQETVEQGVTGLLCASEDHFAEAMATLLRWHDSDRERWQRMGQAARDRVERLMSPSVFALRLEEILCSAKA